MSLAVLSVLCFAPSAGEGQETPPGLYNQDGVLMRAGKPYRGVGANYFSLFGRIVRDPNDRSSLDALPKLAEAKVPFVRFMCGGYWPVEQKLYLADREEFLRRLDRVVKAAEEARIGLIPSLFWHLPTLCDLAGEPLDQLGNPESKSIALLRRYTEDVVQRYARSPVIWGWEFGNENNLSADLPNAAAHRPPVWPNLGTPEQRTERDELKLKDLRVAMTEFVAAVRKHDKRRVVFSGNSVPRTSAFHSRQERTWEPDTRQQFRYVLLTENPDPLDTLTIHTYPDLTGHYGGETRSIDALLELCAGEGVRAKKPLFIGEFGAGRQTDAARERAMFREFVDAIVRHKVPLSAFWVFDLPMQEEFTVTFANQRSYVLELVAEANKRLQAEPK